MQEGDRRCLRLGDRKRALTTAGPTHRSPLHAKLAVLVRTTLHCGIATECGAVRRGIVDDQI